MLTLIKRKYNLLHSHTLVLISELLVFVEKVFFCIFRLFEDFSMSTRADEIMAKLGKAKVKYWEYLGLSYLRFSPKLLKSALGE